MAEKYRLKNSVRLKSVMKRFCGKRILVIGDVGLDQYTIGRVERISPEAPVPIVFVEERKHKLGLAANVADNIKALGGVPLLVGVVGHDRIGEDFLALAEASKIDCSAMIQDSRRKTVLKERIVTESQQLLRIDDESNGRISSVTEKKFLETIRSCLPDCDGVIIEDYAKGLLSPDSINTIFQWAKQYQKRIAVDPNSQTPIEVYRGAFVLTPNTKEAEALTGVRILSEKDLIQTGRVLLKKTLASHVVITRGKEGMAVFSAKDSRVHLIPTFAREVYDVSGAGDTVIAVLSLAFAAGGSVEEAAVLGNLAAGVEVEKRGTATVSQDEIRRAMATVEELRG